MYSIEKVLYEWTFFIQHRDLKPMGVLQKIFAQTENRIREPLTRSNVQYTVHP